MSLEVSIGGQVFNVDEAQLNQAQESGKLELSAEGLVIKSKEDFTAYEGNLKRTSYEDGKIAGSEMNVKTLKETLGVDIEGKDINKFADAFKSKIEAELNTKPNEWQEKFNTLQSNYDKVSTDFEGYKQQVETEKLNTLKTGLFNKELSAFDNVKVSSDIALLAIQNKGYDVTFDDNNNPLFTKNGQTLTNTTNLNPLGGKEVMQQALTELNLLDKPTGGTGQGDATGANGKSSFDSFVETQEKQGVTYGSSEFWDKHAEAVKNGLIQ